MYFWLLSYKTHFLLIDTCIRWNESSQTMMKSEISSFNYEMNQWMPWTSIKSPTLQQIHHCNQAIDATNMIRIISQSMSTDYRIGSTTTVWWSLSTFIFMSYALNTFQSLAQGTIQERKDLIQQLLSYNQSYCFFSQRLQSSLASILYWLMLEYRIWIYEYNNAIDAVQRESVHYQGVSLLFDQTSIEWLGLSWLEHFFWTKTIQGRETNVIVFICFIYPSTSDVKQLLKCLLNIGHVSSDSLLKDKIQNTFLGLLCPDETLKTIRDSMSDSSLYGFLDAIAEKENESRMYFSKYTNQCYDLCSANHSNSQYCVLFDERTMISFLEEVNNLFSCWFN